VFAPPWSGHPGCGLYWGGCCGRLPGCNAWSCWSPVCWGVGGAGGAVGWAPGCAGVKLGRAG